MTVTGFSTDRLFWRDALGGEHDAPLPAGLTFAADAAYLQWDPSTLTLTWIEGEEMMPHVRTFTPAELEAAIAAGPVPFTPPPPASITPVQLRLWCLANGKDLPAAVAAIADAEVRAVVETRLEYATRILRDDPSTAVVAALLGLSTEAEIDAAFRAAAAIE